MCVFTCLCTHWGMNEGRATSQSGLRHSLAPQQYFWSSLTPIWKKKILYRKAQFQQHYYTLAVYVLHSRFVCQSVSLLASLWLKWRGLLAKLTHCHIPISKHTHTRSRGISRIGCEAAPSVHTVNWIELYKQHLNGQSNTYVCPCVCVCRSVCLMYLELRQTWLCSVEYWRSTSKGDEGRKKRDFQRETGGWGRR